MSKKFEWPEGSEKNYERVYVIHTYAKNWTKSKKVNKKMRANKIKTSGAKTRVHCASGNKIKQSFDQFRIICQNQL